MLNREGLRAVIESLMSKSKPELCAQIIDHFYSISERMEEFDALGEMSLISKYYKMYLQCAIDTYTRCKTSEQFFAARTNLYKALNTLNYPNKALFYIEMNLRIDPKDEDAIASKAFSLSLMKREKEAEEISVIGPNTKQSDIDLITCNKDLREGRTAKGIISFIATHKPENWLFAKKLKLKFWDGTPQPGRTIVINGEGGIGDELINIRFMDHLKDYGMKPILYSAWYEHRKDITDLFRRHGHEVVTNSLFFHKDWLWTNMMPLPGYLGVTEADLWRGPYLTPIRDPKNKLNDNKFKIGIKCNGNPYFDQDIYRSIPIEEMLEVLPKNASVYYFDKEKTHPDTISLKDKLNTWEDTLDYIDQMDVIVSSCTSLVHAAGAMGKRTFVITPIAEYYIWVTTRTDESSPWYGDNFKVLKQQTLRSWKDPLNRVRELLHDN
jgi:hypothetical protein